MFEMSRSDDLRGPDESNPGSINIKDIQEQYLCKDDISKEELEEYFHKINPKLKEQVMKEKIVREMINYIRRYPPERRSITKGVLPNGEPRYDSPQCQPVFLEGAEGHCWILYYMYIRGGAPYYDWDLAEQDVRVKKIFESGEFYVTGLLGLEKYDQDNPMNINLIPERIDNLRFISVGLTNLSYGDKGWYPPKEYNSECGNWVIKPQHEGLWGLFRVRSSNKKNGCNYLDPIDFCSAPHHYITSTFLDAEWRKIIVGLVGCSPS
jgi:hypothetical protein